MLALVTGASSGIGAQYAFELARRGHDLIIVSNQEKELGEVAQEIAETYHVGVEPICMDLARSEAAEELYGMCQSSGKKVEILVNDAGVFFFNSLMNTDMRRIDVMLQLHVVTVTKLCRLFGEDMKREKQGYILNMSSLSAWMMFPGISVYESTKAYLRSFSVALSYELNPFGVGVTAVCPGAVDTGLYNLSMNLRRLAVRLGVSIPPEKLAKKAIAKMFKKRRQYIPGLINYLFLPFCKYLPDFLISLIMKKIECFQK